MIRIIDGKGYKFKVTRRLPELAVSDTKIFYSKKKARELFAQWLK